MFVGTVENHRTILSAYVTTLAVEGGGIMGFEENFEKFLIRDNFGVKLELDGFGVTSGAGGDLFIGGVFGGTASVAGDNGLDTFEAFENCLGTPETTIR